MKIIEICVPINEESLSKLKRIIMTSEQIDFMTQSGLLFLDRKQRKSHYNAANTIKMTALIPVALFFVIIIKDGLAKLDTLIIMCSIMALVFLLAGHLTKLSQQRKLKLISFETGMSQSDNYALTKKSLDALQWTIGQDTPNFIKAYNPHRDLRTWGNEMVSIVLLDNRILLNSICNLDTMSQVMLTLGKNKENTENFIVTFEFIAQNKAQ